MAEERKEEAKDPYKLMAEVLKPVPEEKPKPEKAKK